LLTSGNGNSPAGVTHSPDTLYGFSWRQKWRCPIKQADEEKRKPNRVISPELHKLYESFGLDEAMQPSRELTGKSIPWVRVHNLPAYVYFDHRAHIIAGVTCQRCHGPVESMERVRQVEGLSMGWCVNCHRDASANGIDGKPVHASTDCAVCHY
jgi:hypothetical protein